MNDIVLELNNIYDQYRINIINENYNFMKLIIEVTNNKSFYMKFIDRINEFVKFISDFFKNIIKKIKNKFIEIRNNILSKLVNNKSIEKDYNIILKYYKNRKINESESMKIDDMIKIDDEIRSSNIMFYNSSEISRFVKKQKEIIENRFKYYKELNDIYNKYNNLNTDPYNYTIEGRNNKDLFILYKELNDKLSNIPEIDNKTTNSISLQKLDSIYLLVDDMKNKYSMYNKNTANDYIKEMKTIEDKVLNNMNELKSNLNNDLNNIIKVLNKVNNSDDEIDKIFKN